MKSLVTFWRWLRSLGRSRAVKREIDEELRLHVELRTAENIAAGMSPEEAAQAARKRFGNLQSVREECREVRGASFGEATLHDIRFGLRMLRKNPGFTAVAVLSLALGIGANTAIYTVVDAVLLSPVPGPNPERLIQISERDYDSHNKPLFPGVSSPVLNALNANREFFTSMAWFEPTQLARKTEDFTETIGGGKVPPNFFAICQGTPLLGRTFAADEAQPGRDSVIVLSHAFWRSLLGADPQAIGKRIELGGRQWTVIGVMPPSFGFPHAGYKCFWVPAAIPPPDYHMTWKALLVARLKDGVTVQQTQAMLDTVARRLTADRAGDELERGSRNAAGLILVARPLRYVFLDEIEWRITWGMNLRGTLFGLMGAIGFVLLIVCANVANLTLARTERRQQELAVRAALGAGRGRLMRQFLTESVLLALFGGLSGLVVTVWGIKLLSVLIPEGMPRLRAIELDWAVLELTLLISLGTGLLFGCVPAWHAGRSLTGEALKQGSPAASSGVGRRRYRGALVVAEVALTLVLLTGAGLMIESVVRLLHVNPGYDPENLLRVNFFLPGKYARYGDQADRSKPSGAARNLLLARLRDQFAAMPGVKAVGVGRDHGWGGTKYRIDDRNETADLRLEGCGVEESDLFLTMRIPLLAGRYFDKGDISDGVGTAIINETMARLCWPGQSAVGKTFREDRPRGRVFQIVGVVGDARIDRYDEKVQPTFFRPYHEFDIIGLGESYAVRTTGDPRTLIAAIRRTLKEAEPSMEPPRFIVSREALYDSTAGQRIYMLYLVVFAVTGLFLAALGIYGVLAYSVGRRTHEIGIRMAMGAERADVLRMVMAEGARLVGMGVGVGLLAAFWLTRLLRNQLFQVSPTDPVVLGGVVLLLFVVALLACYLPARRATRINPMTALRYE